MKNLKTLVHSVSNTDPKWSEDFKRHTKFVKEVLDNYLSKDHFFACSTLFHFSDSEMTLKDKNIVSEYKNKCLNVIDISREHTHNAIIFTIYNATDSFIDDYIKKNKQNIDSEKLSKGIEVNLNSVNMSKIDILQKYFSENNSYALLRLMKRKRCGEEVSNDIVNQLTQLGIKDIKSSKTYQRNQIEMDGYVEKIPGLKIQKE